MRCVRAAAAAHAVRHRQPPSGQDDAALFVSPPRSFPHSLAVYTFTDARDPLLLWRRYKSITNISLVTSTRFIIHVRSLHLITAGVAAERRRFFAAALCAFLLWFVAPQQQIAHLRLRHGEPHRPAARRTPPGVARMGKRSSSSGAAANRAASPFLTHRSAVAARSATPASLTLLARRRQTRRGASVRFPLTRFFFAVLKITS